MISYLWDMRALRLILFPFSLVYGLITFVRNKCYDWGIFKSYTIPVRSICVGNLSTGGTGKTPHVNWLAEQFSGRFNTSILSRGYGRATKGFVLADANATSNTIGDEALYQHLHFGKKVHVAVCEDRKTGIIELKKRFPDTSLVILDDAFQHRAVKPGFSILLTDHNSPYFRDLLLPAGNLRESRNGRKRADVVIVTKCPVEMDESAINEFLPALKFDPDRVFFSHIIYKEPVPLLIEIEEPLNVLLITGIANPEPLKRHLSSRYNVEHLAYGDHYAFTAADIERIHQKFDTFAGEPKIILTTEKDFMRLRDRTKEWRLDEYPWYYQPIGIKIRDEERLMAILNDYVGTV